MNQLKKFCTGSETNCTKGKTELQHIRAGCEISQLLLLEADSVAQCETSCLQVFRSNADI